MNRFIHLPNNLVIVVIPKCGYSSTRKSLSNYSIKNKEFRKPIVQQFKDERNHDNKPMHMHPISLLLNPTSANLYQWHLAVTVGAQAAVMMIVAPRQERCRRRARLQGRRRQSCSNRTYLNGQSRGQPRSRR